MLASTSLAFMLVGGAGAALIPVDQELVVVLARRAPPGTPSRSPPAVSGFIAPTSVLARAAASFTIAQASTNPG